MLLPELLLLFIVLRNEELLSKGVLSEAERLGRLVDEVVAVE